MNNSATLAPTVLKNIGRMLVVYRKPIHLWALFILSAISFLTTFYLPYQGEEAVYTLTSLEMWYHKEWFVPTLYGQAYGRPPLYNWAIIPIASWLGWEQMLVAARMVTCIATLGSTLLLFYFTERIFNNRLLTLLTVCIYLSGDLLWRRGWLAYADPLFSFFVFLSLMSLWLCVERRNIYWIFLAVLGLIASYLCKAFTGYCFYAITALVFLGCHPHAKILIKSPLSLFLHSCAVLFIFLWSFALTQGAHQESMILDIVNRLSFETVPAYLLKLLTFPLDSFYRFLPATGLLLYFWLKARLTAHTARERQEEQINSHPAAIKLIFWVFFLNYLVYWMVPFARIRYLLPLYPFMAILLAYGIYQLRSIKFEFVILSLWACLLVKYVLGCWGYAYYEQHHRGCYQTAAQDIISRIGDFPLYVDTLSATGLSVAAHLDILRLPLPPLKNSPDQHLWEHGFILSDKPPVKIPDTKIANIYTFGSRQVYLLCRSKACLKSKKAIQEALLAKHGSN